MSFIYAYKYFHMEDGVEIERTSICSDTKIILKPPYKINWSDRTSMLIQEYGMIKAILVEPRCCIAFAGNNSSLAHKLLEELYSWGEFHERRLYQRAYDIHMEASDKDDIEFIICTIDDNNKSHLVCIKERQIQYDCLVAWIGSVNTFQRLQELNICEIEKNKETGNKENGNRDSLFVQAIESGVDDSVGGFPIFISHSVSEKQMIYSYFFYSAIERSFEVEAGQDIKLVDSIENGGYAIEIEGIEQGVLVKTVQNNRGILYTQKYRNSEFDIKNKDIRYFLLPMEIDFSTGCFI